MTMLGGNRVLTLIVSQNVSSNVTAWNQPYGRISKIQTALKGQPNFYYQLSENQEKTINYANTFDDKGLAFFVFVMFSATLLSTYTTFTVNDSLHTGGVRKSISDACEMR